MGHAGIKNATKISLRLSIKFVCRHNNVNHITAIRNNKTKEIEKNINVYLQNAAYFNQFSRNRFSR